MLTSDSEYTFKGTEYQIESAGKVCKNRTTGTWATKNMSKTL